MVIGHANPLLPPLFADEQPEELPTTKVPYDTEFFVKSGFIVVRVGSPLYNSLRDMRRNVRELNPDAAAQHIDAILEIEKFGNVGPNTLLIIRGAAIQKGELHFNETGIKYYLYREATGLMELVFEPTYNMAELLVVKNGIQPVVDVITALASDVSMSDRLEDDALAIWDSARGPAYAVLDIPDQLSHGDVFRATKAVVRIPVSILDLGLTLGNKITRLPFDIFKTSFDGFQWLIKKCAGGTAEDTAKDTGDK